MTMFIKADSLFDSVRGEFIQKPVITVEGDLIADVRYGEINIPSDGEVINLEGCTLFPGLIDAHDHLSLSPQLENHPMLMNDPDPLLMLRGIVNMKTDLINGITTSRCLGEKNYVDLYLKDAVEQGIVEGPRIITCTRGIKTTHAHGSVGTVFNGVEAIRQAVRENIHRGCDFVKIFVTDTIPNSGFMPYYISSEEIRVAVEEAHRVGKKVAAHSVGGDGLTHCIEEGVDVIEHAYFATNDHIDSLLKHDRWVVLTPSIFFNDSRWAKSPEAVFDEFKQNREVVLERHQTLIQSGVKYAVGTDATHGQLVDDVVFLVNIGESMVRALQGITINAAKVSEMDHVVGSIETGKFADLVAIKGDLQKDIHFIKSINWVMKGGKIKVREGKALI